MPQRPYQAAVLFLRLQQVVDARIQRRLLRLVAELRQHGRGKRPETSAVGGSRSDAPARNGRGVQ